VIVGDSAWFVAWGENKRRFETRGQALAWGKKHLKNEHWQVFEVIRLPDAPVN
jgi:hypothetical protein